MKMHESSHHLFLSIKEGEKLPTLVYGVLTIDIHVFHS